jgi:S-adenosylmethionine-diacylglycerol 3-amino-3-carboxypropyl transferase
VSEETFTRAASHDEVRYSQVWEDHALLSAALEVGPGARVLSLASAGCNALALLLDGGDAGPDEVVAVDVSEAQTALLELKLAALRELPDAPTVARFAGAAEASAGERLAQYGRLRASLTAAARTYWDARAQVIESGVIGCGLLDRYIAAWVPRYVRPLAGAEQVTRFLAAAGVEQQRALFASSLRALEPAVREFFSRPALTGRARDESQFAHVRDVDVGGEFWRRFTEVCTTVPVRGNFYLEYVLTGAYADLDLGPVWLRPANFDKLRARLHRVRIVRGELGAFLDGAGPESFTGANLSDVFEYLDPAQTRALLEALRGRLAPGGRIAYWNLFVPRSASEHADGFEPVDGVGERLFRGDRVPFYGSFHVDRRA